MRGKVCNGRNCTRNHAFIFAIYINSTWPLSSTSPTVGKSAKLSVKCCLARPNLAGKFFVFCLFLVGGMIRRLVADLTVED